MTSIEKMDMLSEQEQTVYEQLEQIFPNHEQSVIKETVLNVSKHEQVLEHCLDRCIEEMVNISPFESHRKGPIKYMERGRTALSTLQKDVLSQLTQIFPNYERKIIRTAVCHPSNVIEPLTKPALLQRCIDDILDGRTALEADQYADFDHDVEESTDIAADDEVSITKVEEAKDVFIASTEEAGNIILSDDEDELPSIAEVVDVKTTSAVLQPVQGTVCTPNTPTSLPTLQPVSDTVCAPTSLSTMQPVQSTVNTTSSYPTVQPAHCLVNIISGTDAGVSDNQTVTKCLNKGVPIVKPGLKTGLTAATAHISLSEQDDSTDLPPVPLNPEKTKIKSENVDSLKYDPADEKAFVKTLVDKQACHQNSTSSTETSFNVSRADLFSASTIDSSDSDMSVSPTDSLNSLPDDDALPQITFPKKIHVRDSVFSTPTRFSSNTVFSTPTRFSANTVFSTPTRFSANTMLDRNLGSQQRDCTSVKLDNKDTTSDEVGGSEQTKSDTHLVAPGPSLGSSSGFSKISQSKFRFSPAKFTFTPNSRPLPHSHEETKQDQVEGMVGFTPNTAQFTPMESQTDKTWTPPCASTNQQTVTIESTHKITYNNLVKECMMRQSALRNNEDIGGAKPKYSMSAPNLTVQVPLGQPKLEFMDMLENRAKLPASSTITSKPPNDHWYQNNSYVPTNVPRRNPLIRPPKLSRPESAGDVYCFTKPSDVTLTATGTTPLPVPKPILRNPSASHTAPNPETFKSNQSPFLIRYEPVDQDLERPNPVHIFVPEDDADTMHVVRPEPVQKDTLQDAVRTEPTQKDIVQDIVPPEPVQKGTQQNPVRPEPVQIEIPEDPVVQVKNDVLNLFPDVEPGYLDTLCQQHVGPMAVNNICFLLLEEKYPKKESKSVTGEKKENVLEMQAIDYYKDYQSLAIPADIVVKYQAQAFQKLAQEFLWLSANDIKAVMRRVRYFYAPSYKALQTVWRRAIEVAQKKATSGQPALTFRGLIYQANIPADEAGGAEYRIAIKLLKNRRPLVRTNFDVIPELQREVDFVKRKLKDKELEDDRQVAVALNEQEYEDQGQCIECGCCFGEYPFEQMVQCYEGHLFCENCLRQYAKESVFGQGKADLKCMTDLCDSSFPKSQLLKALPVEILEKYEDRVTEENLNLADLGDLVKCPHCDFRAFMDPGDKVFRCQSEVCKKESCRYCEVAWEEHFGKKCSEVEKKDETKLRLEYEEKMTKAKVRVCHRCKAQFMKLDGCNKMTCRCGAKMCYICRQPNIDYSHFCRHPRDPGKECSQCKACNLWTNPEEDENRAVAEMQKEAEEERKKKGYTESKVIGVPDQPPTKKVKR